MGEPQHSAVAEVDDSGEFPVSSAEVDKICPAFARAQAQVKRARKDSKNPGFKGSDGQAARYADLASVMDACMEALTKHDLFVLQPLQLSRRGEPVLLTRVYHASGQWLQGVVRLGSAVREEPKGPVIPGSEEKRSRNPVQLLVAEVTYLRRCCLAAMVGVAADDDDDGNSAEGEVALDRQQGRQQAATSPAGVPQFRRG